MATYVLVHGGGHGGWCYAKVKRILEAAGHEVFAPSLSGLAEHARVLSPAIDLEFHIDDVVELLRYWDLRDVVLVGHSYGGMVITASPTAPAIASASSSDLNGNPRTRVNEIASTR